MESRGPATAIGPPDLQDGKIILHRHVERLRRQAQRQMLHFAIMADLLQEVARMAKPERPLAAR